MLEDMRQDKKAPNTSDKGEEEDEDVVDDITYGNRISQRNVSIEISLLWWFNTTREIGRSVGVRTPFPKPYINMVER